MPLWTSRRFDWLMAMDDGAGHRHRYPEELLAKDEQAISTRPSSMMPRPSAPCRLSCIRVASPDETPAIGAEGLAASLAISSPSTTSASGITWRDLRLPRLEWNCGKSTAMKMRVGFLPASSTYWLFRQADGLERRTRRGATSAPRGQAFSLYGELTVAQEPGTPRPALSPAARKGRGPNRGAARSSATT